MVRAERGGLFQLLNGPGSLALPLSALGQITDRLQLQTPHVTFIPISANRHKIASSAALA
jgi:hypothetical protein